MKKEIEEEKRFEVDVDIKFTQVAFAQSKFEAIEQVKASFLDEYNLDLTDKEIKSIKEIK